MSATHQPPFNEAPKWDDFKETAPLLPSQKSAQNEYPQPLTQTWRIQHCTAYLIGGTTFLAGSIQYLPHRSDYELGGWLFTVGSAAFLFADIFEWNQNNKVGCAFYDDQEDDYEEKVGKYYGPKDTYRGSYLRKENGLNFGFSIIGSALYLIGSILFIPSTNELVVGTVVFIWGSSVIFLSQLWKVMRQGLTDPSAIGVRAFKISNYSNDLAALGVDASAGLGGLSYLVGSVYFLPLYDVDDSITTQAAAYFIAGGAFFTLSGMFIFYRYFCSQN